MSAYLPLNKSKKVSNNCFCSSVKVAYNLSYVLFSSSFAEPINFLSNIAYNSSKFPMYNSCKIDFISLKLRLFCVL